MRKCAMNHLAEASETSRRLSIVRHTHKQKGIGNGMINPMRATLLVASFNKKTRESRHYNLKFYNKGASFLKHQPVITH